MIYANMATIPERIEMVKIVVKSIIDQVDHLYLFANNCYHELAHDGDMLYDNLYTWSSDNEKMDCEKFVAVDLQKGYIFTIDDDLIYPPDYVQTMIDHIERYKRKAIITLHGRTFGRFPIKSYYRDETRKGYHWDRPLAEDVQVHSGGTGVMAWHSDTITIDYDRITFGNCADVWMAVFAREANVPIMCVAHETGWLQYLDPKETIYKKHYNDDKKITELYNDGR